MLKLTIAAAAGVAALAGSAAASAAVRVEYSDRFTTTTPGAPTGRVFHDEFFDANDPNAKPPALQRFHLTLPKGARFDTSAVPACGASDGELMAQGPAACHNQGSQVGREVFSFDTGFDGPNRIVTNDIDFLNDPGQIIILTRERQSRTRVVVRGTLTESTEDFELDPLPGTPPDGGADKREDGTYPITTGPGGRAWLTTPPTCPASGKWTFKVDYTFRDGEKVTKTSDSPCTAPAPARVTFFHRQHGRTIRVRASAATKATLRVAGRTRALQLNAGLNRVRLPKLAPGTYLLTLTPDGGSARKATLRVR